MESIYHQVTWKHLTYTPNVMRNHTDVMAETISSFLFLKNYISRDPSVRYQLYFPKEKHQSETKNSAYLSTVSKWS